MENIISLFIVQLTVSNVTASIVAMVTSLVENKSQNTSLLHKIIVSILAAGIAGAASDYLPHKTIYIAILVGVMSGITTDDILDKITLRFPDFVDKTLEIILSGTRDKLSKWFGYKPKEDSDNENSNPK